MPTYNILGLNIFIPDLNDIYNAIVQPVYQVIQSAVNFAYQGIITVINSVISSVTAGINSLSSTMSSLFTSIQSGLNYISSVVVNSLSGIVSSVYNALQGVYSFISNTVVPAIQSGFNYVSSAVYSALTSIQSSIYSGISSLGSTLSSIGNSIVQQVSGFVGYVGQGINSLGGALSSIGNSITSALSGVYNALRADLGAVGQSIASSVTGTVNSIGKALGDIGKAIVDALNQYIVAPLQAFIRAAGQSIHSAIASFDAGVKKLILGILPKTPDDAVNAAINASTVGLIALISGEVIGLAVEAVYPTKHWGIPEAIRHGLEYTGVLSIMASLYEIIIHSSYGTLMQYYFNYNIQPRRIDIDRAIRAVWFNVLSIDDLKTELRYEGYSNDAIQAIVSSIYRPMSPFILERLAELQVVSDDFVLKQLLREGFDPADVKDMLIGFKNLALQGFQSSAKSMIFSMYKDGFINADLAQKIMQVFAVPAEQQKWILTLANYQFKYEQQQLLKEYILDAIPKAVLSPDAAVSALVAIGMDKTRAEILVKIKGITTAPPPPKSVRENILKEALAIPLEVS